MYQNENLHTSSLTRITNRNPQLTVVKPGFHKANFYHDNDKFQVKTKQLVGRTTAQPHNSFAFLCRGRGVCCKWKPGLTVKAGSKNHNI